MIFYLRFTTQYVVLCKQMQTSTLTYNYVDEYLRKIQSKGRYSVTLAELITQFSASKKAILQNIYRLKGKNRLAQVRKEFYVVVPPQYSDRGMVPPTLFIADMMSFLNRDYYVALLSAAALHGAGHQQPMEFQVITKKPPLRDIQNQKLNIRFITKSNWKQDQVMEKKTEAGYLKVSTPELTTFDLVHHHQKIGGLNRIIPILEELAEDVKSSLLTRVAKNQKIPDIQRLGYLFDELGEDQLSDALFRYLGNKSKGISLSLNHRDRTGTMNEKWKVVVNTELDF